MRRYFRIIWQCATLTVACTGCNLAQLLVPQGGVTGDLSAARIKWSAHGPARYDFTLDLSGCECAFISPVTVSVANGVVFSVSRVGESTPLPPEQWPSEFRSIDGIFAAAADAIDRRAFVVRGDYDSTLGYPHELFIDWKGSVADDEITYRVSDLRAR